MNAAFIILFILVCLIGGFAGMTFLFVFPVVIMLAMIIILVYVKHDSSKVKDIEEDKILEEDFMFEEMTDNHK